MRALGLCDLQEHAALKMVRSRHVDSDRRGCKTSWPMIEEAGKHRGRHLERAGICRSRCYEPVVAQSLSMMFAGRLNRCG
ncbi:hypothetical protein AXF42_Ash012966 [Apostasia shenzhenica]|uniref:Uncharacterized protein n=1 Tax=Apostasia shenzhenica TaxID=1088818 RepID=A0A2I0ARR9_9ASPA|nr:hypothetical protein AXF42_Ash012966 [Apostasia shenzhenica]